MKPPGGPRPQPGIPGPSASATFEYRPALDGVRAVAVLAVIAFHFTTWLPGGFLGVDVFFVLSGYLITTLLLHEHRTAGSISLGNFWARRARRLLPALFLLVAVCAVAIGRYAPFSTLDSRRDDMFATLFYYANWHFIGTLESYFAQFEGASPFRHAWSLAIEEQFYLVFPLAMVCWFAFGRGRTWWLLGAICAAFVVSVVAMAYAFRHGQASRAYYGTDTRGHMLLAGIALAIVLFGRPELVESDRAKAVARRAWPAVVILFLVALATYRDDSPRFYQGGAAMFAILIAVALWMIEAAPESGPGRFLSLRPLVWTGTVSYGLYLWHWPIIVWLGGSQHPNAARVLALALTFAAAVISFFLVEKPVRQGRVPWIGRSKSRLALAAAVAAAAVAGFVQLQMRVPPAFAAVEDPSEFPCPEGSPEPWDGYLICEKIAPARRGNLVIATIGDSTAGAFDPGMRKIARERGWRYVQASQSGCSILPLTLPHVDAPNIVAEKRMCIAAVSAVLAETERFYRPDVWLVSDEFPINLVVLDDGRVLRQGDPERRRVLTVALRGRLRLLTRNGARVVVVGVPPKGQPVECADRRRAGDAECRDRSHTTRDPVFSELDAMYRAGTRGARRTTYIRITDVMCPRGVCVPVIDGVIARYDGTHYTATYSRKIVKIIVARAELAGALRKRAS